MENAKVAHELCSLFDAKITSYYRDTFKGLFGKTQLDVLNYLHQNKIAKPQEMADSLNMPKQHASKILLKFEEINIVESKKDEIDKRGKIYKLSTNGLELINAHLCESNNNLEQLVKRLDKEEQKEFLDAMVTMIKILKKL